jgi:hypothetical protein
MVVWNPFRVWLKWRDYSLPPLIKENIVVAYVLNALYTTIRVVYTNRLMSHIHNINQCYFLTIKQWTKLKLNNTKSSKLNGQFHRKNYMLEIKYQTL